MAPRRALSMSGDVTPMPLGPGAQERVHALVRTIKRGQVQSCNPAESHVVDAHVRRAVHGEETCLRTVALQLLRPLQQLHWREGSK